MNKHVCLAYIAIVLCCMLGLGWGDAFAQNLAQDSLEMSHEVKSTSSPTKHEKDHPSYKNEPSDANALCSAFEPTKLESIETWFDDVKSHTNTTCLEQAFLANHYSPGPDAYAFIAVIRKDSTGQDVYKFFSYRDTAFKFSLTPDGKERFWPASTVKLTAAVVALMRAEEVGVTADDPVSFIDLGIKNQTTLRQLVRDAIIPSDNLAYNSLMLFAGLDRANDEYIRKRLNFPCMVLQRRYQRKDKDDNLRFSPAFSFKHAEHTIVVPEAVSTQFFEHVPRESNALMLVELAEMLRRVMTGQMLALSDDHLSLLRTALLEAPSCIDKGVKRLIPNAKIYNKGGKVIGDDRLEIAYITDDNNVPRYLLALSLPYSEIVEQKTQELAWQMIHAVQE